MDLHDLDGIIELKEQYNFFFFSFFGRPTSQVFIVWLFQVYLHTAPLCHIGGLSSAMAMLMVGACHVFIPKFEARLALEAIEQHRVTSLITVPAIMADLISSIR